MARRRTAIPDNRIPLEQAFDRYYPAIFCYFRYRGADADTANDLASSTFEHALESLGRFDPKKAQIQTWLFAIAHNLAINHWKADSNHPTISLEELYLPEQNNLQPEDSLIDVQDRQEILQALQHLDMRAIEIIALKFGGRLSNRQIAGLTNLSESNVGVILYRSLLKLRTVLASSRTEVQHERR